MEQTGVPAAVRALPQRLPEYGRVLARAESGSCCAVYGLSPVHRAQLAAALRESLPERSFCAVFRDEQAARLFAADYQTLTGEEAAVLPARDMVFHSMEGISREYEQQRLGALAAIRSGKCRMLCAPADALMQRTLPPEALGQAAFTLENGGSYDVEALAGQLTLAGYVRCSQVEGAGQFALRGGYS